MEACGYDKYHEVISSDHRGIFLDLSIQGLFGGKLPAIFTPSSRVIKGDHPKNITAYIRFMDKYI